jgi:hypothetical protein
MNNNKMRPAWYLHKNNVMRTKDPNVKWILSKTSIPIGSTVKPVLNGISGVQNIFPLKSGFRLIKVYYDSHRTLKYFRLRQNSV